MMNAPMNRKIVSEENARGECEDRRGRDGDGLREPVDYGKGEYGGQRLLVLLQRQRHEVHDQEHYRPEDETDRLPRLLEALLRRGEHLPLLVECLVCTARTCALAHTHTSINVGGAPFPAGSIASCEIPYPRGWRGLDPSRGPCGSGWPGCGGRPRSRGRRRRACPRGRW